jgi:hypothetical protein
MTRIQDGSPRPPLQPETPSDSVAPPRRGVLVSYDEFKDRRELRLRVTAAFEKLQRERTLDGTS